MVLIKIFGQKKILNVYVLSFVVVSFYASLQLLFSFFGWQDPFADQILSDTLLRPNAFCYEPSYLALYMTPFVMGANVYYLVTQQKIFKWIILVNIFYLITTSASVIFAFAACLLVLTVFSFFPFIKRDFPDLRRKIIKSSLFLLTICIVTHWLFPTFSKDIFLKFFVNDFASHHSFFLRWEGIKDAWNIFLKAPFFGIGYGGYAPYLFDLWSHGAIKLDLPAEISHLSNSLKIFEPSNVFTEILASVGSVGLVGFLFFFVFFLKQGIQLLKNKTIEKESKALYFSLLISSIVMLIVLQFNQGILRTYVWTHLGLCLAIFLEHNAFKKSIV